MYPYLRWLRVVLRRRGDPGPQRVLEESRLWFHVWPGDLDFFGHMNNGRYLTLMDSGRWDLIAQVGLMAPMRAEGWTSVIGGATILFRRPLRPFQRFELLSRIVGWDEKWFFVEQQFVADGKLVARAAVRGLFRAPGRSVPVPEVLARVGVRVPSPEVPSWVQEWSRLVDAHAVASAEPREPV